MLQHNAFTTRYDKRVRVLKNEVQICLPYSLEEMREKVKNNEQDFLKKYTAIWDTGATGSVITKKVIKDLNLKPTGLVEVNHAQGKTTTNTYLVNIALPLRVIVGPMKVIEGVLPDDTEILIGMDIISGCDFAVTHGKGFTKMSFKIPSTEDIDFVHIADRENIKRSGGNRAQRRALEKELKRQNKKKLK